MNKKKVESKLTKAKKKLVKAESKVAKLQSKLTGTGKAVPAKKAASKSTGKNGKPAPAKAKPAAK